MPNTTPNTKMPTLFIGHGSPMNALAHNQFSKFLNKKGESLQAPKAILAVSAHWETRGTQVLKVAQPETIHDFGGFPKELFEVEYPAQGSPQTADQVATLLKSHHAITSSEWGLDHGTWSLLVHMYPKANIPVLQLSLNRNLNLKGHFELARDLKKLRDQGVLILGSGNITHNLRAVNWEQNPKPFDWAVEFDELIKNAILNDDKTKLFNEDPSLHSLWKQALPTLEHYIPLMYVLGSGEANDKINFPYTEMQMGSLSMRAVEMSA